MAEVYTLNLGDDRLMRSMTWRWFRVLIEGLLDRPIGHDLAGSPVWSTRMQAKFLGPLVETKA